MPFHAKMSTIVRRCLSFSQRSTLLPLTASHTSIPYPLSRAASHRPTPSPPVVAPSARPPPPKRQDKTPRDEEIPHQTICLVDPTTSSLLPPSTLTDILLSLDRTRFFIQVVDTGHSPPICKIIDKKEQYAKEKSKKKPKLTAVGGSTVVASSGPPKEVHLSWGVTPHDLKHKLAKGKSLIEKGNRLTIYLTTKKHSVTPDARSRSEVIKAIQEALQDVAKLTKPPSETGSQAILDFDRLP